MMERFLQYSLRHQRRIKLVWQAGEHIKSANLTVLAMDDTHLTCQLARKGSQPLVILRSDALAATYIRGDTGELYPPLSEGNPDEKQT